MAFLLLLLFLQTLWASTYVVWKMSSSLMPVGMVLVVRYGIALLALCSVVGCRRWMRGNSAMPAPVPWRGRDAACIAAIGLLNFALGPYLQIVSLQMTLAADAAVIVALEPVVTAILAACVLHERLDRRTVLTFLIGTVGIAILSGVRFDGTAAFGTTRWIGNGLFATALLSEAAYSVASGRLTQRYDPLRLITWMIAAGMAGNLAVHWPNLTWSQLTAVPWSGWLLVAYLGLCCSAFGYAAWTYLARRIPVSRLALSLLLQPILGGGFGALVLGESLDWHWGLGATLTLSSLIFWLRPGFIASHRPCIPTVIMAPSTRDGCFVAQDGNEGEDRSPRGC
ncbi:MAG: DMT family transporter [Deltaproteobacteria bacterium]|nr:DMT family transporter [Deltaproteobacteria bacterium]